ncbi:uncharacterized protein TRAVEDRAFT_71786 [Trametes versicolor FP-101664 SS1]|uniref:uncharacterized protein n=1 Tax=Trametes versicolor (strain FP-101664) TaxID=717944 RepID=UPI0004622967|nr:uncharacterized protein TRAVEDRAFT_71786 [Trametes versicolor FP-101664 SS1]EIW59894.1 hypothetical protein TRAVEDRAFT_71786 [Trametes versicolor FP-101664 SS1]
MPPRKKQRTDSGALPVAAVPRRTTRASAKAAQAGIVAGAPCAVTNTKEKTKAAAPIRGKRVVQKGRLQTLPDLAVEVQLEIYNYLDLEDLFNLARTCKKFRTFFLDKTSEKKLWVPARANTPDVPERPSSMSEYSFAHPLYSPHCHNCGRSNVRRILDNCLIRLCATCLREQAIWYQDAYVQVRSRNETLARTLFSLQTIRYYFPVQSYSWSGRSEPKFNHVLKSHLDRILKQIKALPTPITNEALSTFLDKAKEYYYESRLPYAEAVSLWMDKQDEKRRTLLEDARKQRFEAILDRLRDAGWGKELDFMGAEGIETMSDMPVVRQSTKLTNGAWLKVQTVLDRFLSDTRAKRLDEELRTALRARFDMLEEVITAHYVTLPRTARMEFRPQYIDFALTPECRAIADVPTSETVTADQFAAVVPALAKQWHADRRAEFTAYLLPHLGDIAPDVDPLTLAISVFRDNRSCYGPFGLMRYPAVLAHNCGCDNCFRTDHSRTTEEYFADDLYTRTTKSLGWTEAEFSTLQYVDEYADTHVPFNLGSLAGPEEAREVIDIVRRVVAALGLDPARATADELERCGVWLRCTSCETRSPKDEIEAMSWSAAYRHERFHMQWDGARRRAPVWRHADDEDMAKLRALHATQAEQAYADYFLWSCSLCPRFDARPAAMTAHLEEAHAILDPAQARRDGVVYLYPSLERSEVFADEISLRARIDRRALGS